MRVAVQAGVIVRRAHTKQDIRQGVLHRTPRGVALLTLPRKALHRRPVCHLEHLSASKNVPGAEKR
jgi:hypothetical protein